MTFSFKPWSVSTLPLIAASVKTLVVSWKDAAERNESLSRAAFVIPRINGLATAGCFPASNTSLLAFVNSTIEILLPGIKEVSPPSTIKTFLNIWRTITSMCLSLIDVLP